jgi:hypothetical protein
MCRLQKPPPLDPDRGLHFFGQTGNKFLLRLCEALIYLQRMPPTPTPFGKYIESNEKLSPKEVAKQLALTRAYVHMLIAGTVTPALKLAWRIEKWSKGAVKMQSWVAYMK